MIEVSAKCPCGTYLVVDITEGDAANRWSCKCPSCYDPTPEPSDKATCLGYGASHEEAIAACWDMIELAWEIDYLPVTLFADLSEQAGDEAERQEGWGLEHGPLGDYGDSCDYYGPLGVSPIGVSP